MTIECLKITFLFPDVQNTGFSSVKVIILPDNQVEHIQLAGPHGNLSNHLHL